MCYGEIIYVFVEAVLWVIWLIRVLMDFFLKLPEFLHLVTDKKSH